MLAELLLVTEHATFSHVQFAADASTPAAAQQTRTLTQFLTFLAEALSVSSFAHLPPATVNLVRVYLCVPYLLCFVCCVLSGECEVEPDAPRCK
jgi:hypothetical protein